jgi:hypothetical protein
MKTSCNPLVWQGLFAVVFGLTLLANQPTIVALVPLLVASSLIYLLVRPVRVLAARRAARAAPPRVTAVRRVAPPIDGPASGETAPGSGPPTP